MKHVLICPSPRVAVPVLSQDTPLAAAPLLGQSLLEYWLSWLWTKGAREVLVLAHDRPDVVERLVGNGARWGLNVQVIAESRELKPAEARLKYGTEREETSVEVLEQFPGEGMPPLFNSYAGLFAALCQWMPFAITADRVGVRQLCPGVWVGSHSHVSPEARLVAPCWVGNHAFVGARAVLGPGTIIEDGAFIEPGVEIVQSLIGPDTFVGSLARVKKSLAWGEKLVNWETGSLTVVPDSFLLCSLRRYRRQPIGKWFHRLTEHYARSKEEALLAWKHLLLHKGG